MPTEISRGLMPVHLPITQGTSAQANKKQEKGKKIAKSDRREKREREREEFR